jgi:predicted type IV restriction endonuclease
MAVDIRKDLKKFLPHLVKAKDENLNEADTVLHLIKFLEVVFGYDPLSEITRESSIKDRYVDIAVRIDGAIRFLIEAKAAGTTLRERHIEQAQNYAANGNIRWVVLTNGTAWQLYHLTFENGIENALAFSVDLTEDGSQEQAFALLGLLHRQSVKRNELEEYWTRCVALSPSSIARGLFTEEALKFIRREIHKREGFLVDEEDLAKAIYDMFTAEAQVGIGPLKIHHHPKTKAGKKPQETPPPNIPPDPTTKMP